MTTKRTILSEKELKLIEAIVERYGIIVTFSQICTILKHSISRQGIRNLASKLEKNGWFVRIKKGVYVITSLESRGFTALHAFKIAQVLVKDSYISFEAALQQHGMFDQYLSTIVSIALSRYSTEEIQKTRYKFIKVGKEHFYGWQEERVESYLIKIATPEKAILDILSFGRNTYSIDLVLEKLREHKDDINFERLNKFSEKQTVAVRRILGFLLDKLSIDSSHIYDRIKGLKNCSYMTKDSDKFNAKWRLYCDPNFVDTI